MAMEFNICKQCYKTMSKENTVIYNGDGYCKSCARALKKHHKWKRNHGISFW